MSCEIISSTFLSVCACVCVFVCNAECVLVCLCAVASEAVLPHSDILALVLLSTRPITHALSHSEPTAVCVGLCLCVGRSAVGVYGCVSVCACACTPRITYIVSGTFLSFSLSLSVFISHLSSLLPHAHPLVSQADSVLLTGDSEAPWSSAVRLLWVVWT